ncbi:MAG: hypothetical protein U1F25_20035 [Rubrivivax sp.]
MTPSLPAWARYIFNRGNLLGRGRLRHLSRRGRPRHRTLPRLAGQHALYTENQLKQLNKRERTNDNAVMHAIASKLTELEMKGKRWRPTSAEAEVGHLSTANRGGQPRVEDAGGRPGEVKGESRASEAKPRGHEPGSATWRPRPGPQRDARGDFADSSTQPASESAQMLSAQLRA